MYLKAKNTSKVLKTTLKDNEEGACNDILNIHFTPYERELLIIISSHLWLTIIVLLNREILKIARATG